MYVAEAVEYAKEELQSAMYRNDDTVIFIVGMYFCLSTTALSCDVFQWLTFLVPPIGQGRHSEDGVPKLRPALEELFDEYVVGDFHTALFSDYSHTRGLLDAG